MTNTRSYPKRVMLTSDTIGGVWRYTLELTRFLRRSGIEVAIVTIGPPPSAAQLHEAHAVGGALVDTIASPLDWTARAESDISEAVADLKRRAALWHADIVHLHAPAYAGHRPWVTRLVVTVHSCLATWWRAAGQGPMPAEFRWRSAATARGLTVADRVIAPSASFANALTVIYGPIPHLKAIHNCRQPARSVSQTTVPRKIILTAGRLWDRGKNMQILDAAAAISGLTIHAAGATNGPGNEAIELRHLRTVGELSEDEMSTWHAKAGVFISPSRYEPFGLAVVEAAQSRTALLLADIPTFRELWDGAALFFDPDNAAELAEQLTRVARSSLERERLARAALERSKHYSADSMGRETLALYCARLRPPESLTPAVGEGA